MTLSNLKIFLSLRVFNGGEVKITSALFALGECPEDQVLQAAKSWWAQGGGPKKGSLLLLNRITEFKVARKESQFCDYVVL